MFIDADARIAAVAAPQHGAFSRAQASAAGFSARMIDYRIKTGRWLLLHPGVYALAGSIDSWFRQQAAATLWCKGAASGRAAGRLHGIPGCEDARIEVITTPAHKVMPRCGVVVHLTNRLPTEQITTVQGIRTTSVERTLLDLCGLLFERRAAIAMDDVLFRGLTTLGSLDHCLYLTARRGRNGCGVMRKLLKKRLHLSEVPNSPLETVIFEMLSNSHLPMPELQFIIRDEAGGFIARPDFVYQTERLVIEGHSKKWHSGELARESDFGRDRKLREEYYLPIYLSWADATLHRSRTIALIDRLLKERRVLFPPGRADVSSS